MAGPSTCAPTPSADAVVIGLGNTTLSDDAAGPRAAALLRGLLPGRPPAACRVDVIELATGGLALMEAMAGYQVAVVLDALHTGRVPVGTIVELDLSDLDGSLHQASVHDMSLPVALEFGRAAGVPLPTRIHVLGVEVLDVTTFGETLTPAVEGSLPRLVRRALDLATQDPDLPVEERNLTPLETSCA